VSDDLAQLRLAITRCGGLVDVRPESIARLAEKLAVLASTGRFGRLLSDLYACNDRSNLAALILEATFAHSFEERGRVLAYEVTQHSAATTSVDFLRVASPELSIYFELRLLQQTEDIRRRIDAQLDQGDRFAIALDGEGEAREVLRLQNVLLSKVQDSRGMPVKFLATGRGDRNIVVVEITNMILGAIDRTDCVLATYGDPQLEEHERRQVFGLFQEPKASYPEHIQAASRRFAHFRGIVHGVLFLYRSPLPAHYDFKLRYFFVPNYSLLAKAEAEAVAKEIRGVLVPWEPSA